MLTADVAATVRAALRFWIDEMLPFDERIANFYFDTKLDDPLNREDTQALLTKFEESRLRFVAERPRQLLSRSETELHPRPETLHTLIISATT